MPLKSRGEELCYPDQKRRMLATDREREREQRTGGEAVVTARVGDT